MRIITRTSPSSTTSTLAYYIERLQVAGFPLNLSFVLVDEGGSELLLIYATKAEKGIERMKDAMWRVDPVYGQRFRDPRDEHQLTLDISDEPDLSLLKRQLLERWMCSPSPSLANGSISQRLLAGLSSILTTTSPCRYPPLVARRSSTDSSSTSADLFQTAEQGLGQRSGPASPAQS